MKPLAVNLFIIVVTSSSDFLTFFDQNPMWAEGWIVSVRPNGTVSDNTIPAVTPHRSVTYVVAMTKFRSS